MATATKTPVRYFTVASKAQGEVTFASTMTDREAAELCLGGTEFARKMARTYRDGRLTANQRAWMHYLALEMVKQQMEDAVPAPIAIMPSAPAVPPVAVQPETPAPLPSWTFDVEYDSFEDTYTITARADARKRVQVAHSALFQRSSALARKLEESTVVLLDRADCELLAIVAKEANLPPVPAIPSVPTTAPASPVETPKAPETGEVSFANRTEANVATGADKVSGRGIYEGGDTGEIRRLVAAKEWVGGEVSLLQYYIPDTLKDRVPNPVRILRRAGFFWMDNSGYCGSEKGFAHPDVKDWLALVERVQGEPGGADLEANVIPFAEKALSRVRALAQRRLDKAVRKAHGRLIEAIDSADKELGEALAALETENEREGADRKRDDRVRGALREAAEQLDGAIKCAQHFDESESIDELLKALRQAIRSRAIAFDAQVMKKPGRRTPSGVV